MKGVALGLAAGFALAGTLVACRRQGPVTDWQQDQAKRNEISDLWIQVRDWRREAHMDLDPTPQNLNAYRTKTIPEAKRVCPDAHEIPKTCEDVCGLAVAICENAEAICKIAGQLGKQDTWSQEKCTSAKASCHESKQRCCDDCSGDK